MKHKIYYRKYRNSETATSFSFHISYLALPIAVGAFAIICYVPMSAIVLVPLLLFLFIKRKSIEQLVSRLFPDRPGMNYPEYTVTDEEYQQAQKIVSWGARHPAVKEIAQRQGKRPQDVIDHYTEVIRNYNLGRHQHK